MKKRTRSYVVEQNDDWNKKKHPENLIAVQSHFLFTTSIKSKLRNSTAKKS